MVRPPHKRIINLCKGQPGQAAGPDSTVIEVGLYADIKAHTKEGRKRRKQAFQFAQEHPEQARPTKRQRPVYEVQQTVCRFWRLGACKKPDCTFKHEGEPITKLLIPCEFHARGACKNGAACNFSHTVAQPCRELVMRGACLAPPGRCVLRHEFTADEVALLQEYLGHLEDRRQKAAVTAASMGLPPTAGNQGCGPQAHVMAPLYRTEAEVEEF